MPDLLPMLARAFDLALVIVGFGLIIFVHELGHFLAARWAGIRVLAFALGFGPAAVSYRKGLGFRSGSSEAEYLKRLALTQAGPTVVSASAPTVSPTEYRLNILPFGGYVKMLGQEDLNPEAVSGAPDSYQNCVPWKRMVVISAGVIMNIITAALIFMLVFKVGLRTEPAMVGFVRSDSPAARAVATNASELGVSAPGLQPGDEIIEIAGKAPRQFSDVVVATAMARRGSPIDLTVKRPGVEGSLLFKIKPETNDLQRLLDIGIAGATANKLPNIDDPAVAKEFERRLAERGAAGVPSGSTLESIKGWGPVQYAYQLERAADPGEPVRANFRTPEGQSITVTLQPRAEFEVGIAKFGEREMAVPHLLGLTGVLTVDRVEEAGRAQGLRAGDIFVRIGAVEFPSIATGVREIRAAAGKQIDAVVRRQTNGQDEDIRLALSVSRAGTIGFNVDDTMQRSTQLGSPLASRSLPADPGSPDSVDQGASSLADESKKPRKGSTAAASATVLPGSTVLNVNDQAVANFADMREAIRAALRSSEPDAVVRLTLRPPTGEATFDLDLAVSPDDRRVLGALGWASPISAANFEPAQILLKATGPLNAIEVGLGETRRVMIMTYLTFVRLFEGSVKVEHLKGPVGIAHVGTLIADRGLIWLLFFMAIISVNLAVVNFLPLPIVDGGQFLFLVYEQVFKRPVPVGFQNAATLAGLVLIGSMFLVVTFNDIMNLFRS